MAYSYNLLTTMLLLWYHNADYRPPYVLVWMAIIFLSGAFITEMAQSLPLLDIRQTPQKWHR